MKITCQAVFCSLFQKEDEGPLLYAFLIAVGVDYSDSEALCSFEECEQRPVKGWSHSYVLNPRILADKNAQLG